MMVAQLIVGLIITAIAARLSSPDGIKKQKLDDFTFPTVDLDRSIPVIFGDVLVEGPNVTWFGDYKAKEIVEGESLFSSGTVVAYSYRIGMELCLCWGEIDHITEVWFGTNQVWIGDVYGEGGLIQIDAPNALGGKGKGGGVKATLTLYPGTAEQGPDPYMTEQLGGVGYTHRGVCKIIWNGPSSEYGGGLVGESSYMQPIKFRAEHYPNFLGSAYKQIGIANKKGANPAEVVYCLLIGRYANVNSTDPVVPVISEGDIDQTSFLAAAQTLYNEGMGISFQWQRDTPVRDIINDIMHHIDGYLSEDSQTGKIRMVLSRQDYNPATVPIFDESNIVDFISYVRLNPTVSVNRLSATFTDPDHEFKQIPIMVEDLGNAFEQDMGAPGDIDLHMFHDVDVVVLRTTRELVQQSEGIISGEFECNRDGYALNIGDPIKLSWEGFGVSELLVRVTEKVMGNLLDRKIKVRFIQDIFGLGTAVYGTPTPTNWVDIYNDPEDITTYFYMEQPYFITTKFLTTGPHKLYLLVKYPSVDTISHNLLIDINSGGYSPGKLAAPESSHTYVATEYKQSYGPGYDTTVGLRVAKPVPEWAEGVNATFAQIRDSFKNWVMVNGELLAYEQYIDNGDGTVTLNKVYRGLLDTSPKTHAVGDIIWFLGGTDFYPVQNVNDNDIIFGDTNVVNIKTITTAGGGQLDEANAAAKTHTIDNRDGKPYRPVNVRINSGYYPDFIIGELSLTWNVRSRLLLDMLRWDNATDELEEVNQSTSLKIYDANGTLRRTVTGLIDGTYTYPLATEVADCGAAQSKLTIELYAERDGEVSHDPFITTVRRQGEPNPLLLSIDLTETISTTSGTVVSDLTELTT